jgi:hypothetical protein
MFVLFCFMLCVDISHSPIQGVVRELKIAELNSESEEARFTNS